MRYPPPVLQASCAARSHSSGARQSLCLVFVLAATACGSSADSPPQTLEEIVAFRDSIELQEDARVINVTPTVTLDWRGGFLVADESEGQLRRYAEDGRLLWHTGRKGRGPGEYRSLTRAVRLPGGQVLAAELTGSFTLYDSTGSSVVETVRNPFFLVQDLDVIDDSTLLVGARLQGNQGSGPSLHLWDLRRHEVKRSFFDPFAGAPNKTAAMIAGWTRAAVRGDTIAAVFALSDTLYFFRLDGRPLGSRPIPFRRFRPVPAETPSGGSDPVRRAQWLSTFDYVAGVYWLPDGRFLVPYQSILPEKALTRKWHLFAMDRNGKGLFELENIPRLLAVEPDSGALYLQSTGSETPNRWTVARLRR